MRGMASPSCDEGPSDACETLVPLIDEWASRQSDRIAYTYLDKGEDPSQVLTFGELGRRARGIAAYLQGRAPPGRPVLLVFPNELDFITAFMGCLLAGLIAVPVAPPRNARGMTRLLGIAESAGASLAVGSAMLRGGLQRLRNTAGDGGGLDWLFVDDIPEGLEDAWRDPGIDAGATAVLQFTSGSTGNQKGVMLSHRNIVHNCRLLQSVCGSSSDLRVVTWLPFFHDWGLIGGLIFPFYAGGTCFIFDPADFLYKPRRWLEAISRFRGTVSCAPNFGYELCAGDTAEAGRPVLDLACWDMAMVGAEPVRKDTIERFSIAFAPNGFRREAFYPCYGLAESTLIVTGGLRSAPPVHATLDRAALEAGRAVPIGEGRGDDAKDCVGCGRPLLDQQVLVADPETRRPCAPLEIGEIWVSGPSVAQGYWGRPDLTRQTFSATTGDGSGMRYLRTGDLGFLWNGELFVCGRLKDVIIKAGANYFAEDIEHSAARSHPGLRPGCGAAFGVEVEGAERLVVVHELNYGKKPDVQRVIGAIQKAVSNDHDVLADAIAILKPGSLEKTSSGKIRRQHTKSLFLSDQLNPVAIWQGW